MSGRRGHLPPQISARSKRPARIGELTRGKTAQGRLRPLDVYLCVYERALLRRREGIWRDAVAVDLGYGRLPWTTLESFRLLRTVAPALEVVGLEIDAERVEDARPFQQPGLTFARGGFEIGVDRPVRLIRAMNVLRQYEEDAAEPAWALMGQRLLPGGLLVEGTSDPWGRMITAALLRRTGEGLALEGLLFACRLGALPELEPSALKPVLPKRWIHRVVPGEPIHAFFEAWEEAWRSVGHLRPFGARQVFGAAARQLAARVPGVATDRWLLRRGYLLWRAEPLADLPGLADISR